MTKSAKARLAATALIGVIISLSLFGSLEAAGKSVAISPLSFDLEAEKGEIVEEEIVVMNSSEDSEVFIEMQAENMFPRGEEGRVGFGRLDDVEEDDLSVLSMAHWIDFEPKEFTLSPREQKSVQIRISVPENADPGGHYAGIIAGAPSEDNHQIEGGGVGITHRVAATTLLSVAGEAVEELSVIDFATDRNYYESGPVTFETRFENTGTVHLRPESTVRVFDMTGREVAEIDLEDNNVLPQATRKIKAEWDTGMLWGGKYTAKLTGVFGEDNHPLGPIETTFQAFPWKVALVALLLIIFFIVTRKRWITIIKILVKGEAALKERE